MRKPIAILAFAVALAIATVAQQQTTPRGNALAPEGAPTPLGLAGYAKVLCSAAGRLGDVREHARARVEAAGVRRTVLGERRRRLADSENAYFANGAGGQRTIIIPTHDLVVVRMRHQRGDRAGMRALRAALAERMAAVTSKV